VDCRCRYSDRSGQQEHEADGAQPDRFRM
jgi:hypothetical protein